MKSREVSYSNCFLYASTLQPVAFAKAITVHEDLSAVGRLIIRMWVYFDEKLPKNMLTFSGITPIFRQIPTQMMRPVNIRSSPENSSILCFLQVPAVCGRYWKIWQDKCRLSQAKTGHLWQLPTQMIRPLNLNCTPVNILRQMAIVSVSAAIFRQMPAHMIRQVPAVSGKCQRVSGECR